ncbi:hypothetical protein [Umezawaea sp. Da 62-37]|uniref:hypothetical protein n=1 Tax=Umezawaea sp. Da 62-37 TaxID=3075927 RepID=UPI0028F6E2F7|nr:hypothetical protein [Umezawaea sp. Da 62-37]WNV85126.1 hypothetical protein RM788_44460 [Umezawaea sp. Da 62-37]
MSDDLALLLAQAGVVDVRSPFAANWNFCLVEDVGGLPRCALPPADQSAQLARRTGLVPLWQRIDGDVAAAVDAWSEALRGGRAVLVVGDAYHLPWLPYAGNEHMEHGFVVEGIDSTDGIREPVVHVVDPYDNTTSYGRATPQTCKVSVGDLATALVGGSWAVLAAIGEPEPIDVCVQVLANAAEIVAAAQDGAFARLVDGHRHLDARAVEHLSLQTWLLSRNRSLHQLWLLDVRPQLREAGLDDLPARFDAEVVTAWRRATEMAYLASRRVHAGRAAPPSVLAAVERALDHEFETAQRILRTSEDVRP